MAPIIFFLQQWQHCVEPVSSPTMSSHRPGGSGDGSMPQEMRYNEQAWWIVNFDKESANREWVSFDAWFFGPLHESGMLEFLQRRYTTPTDPLPHDRRPLQAQWGQIALHTRPSEVDLRSSGCIRPVSWNYSTQANIHVLSPETIARIFAFIPEYADALALGLTNSRLWNIGKTHIGSLITGRDTRDLYWPGDRIICMGQLAEDLPPSLNDVEYDIPLSGLDNLGFRPVRDEEDLRGMAVALFLSEAVPEYGFRSVPLLPVTEPQWTDPAGSMEAFEEWMHPFKRGGQAFRSRGSGWRLDPIGLGPEWADVQASCDGGRALPLDPFERETVWILRNLTTREYTREDDKSFGDLEHRLLSRICWSTEIGSRSWVGPKYLYNGAWAGHSFDVVPLQDRELVEGPDGKVGRVDGWKDVTNAIRREMDDIINRAPHLVSKYLETGI